MTQQSEEFAITKLVLMSVLAAICCILFFCYKVEACKEGPSTCKEKFIEIRDNYNEYECPPGTVSLLVSEPKKGFMCRCHVNVKDSADAPPVSGPPLPPKPTN